MLWPVFLWVPVALAAAPGGPHVVFNSLGECTAESWRLLLFLSCSEGGSQNCRLACGLELASKEYERVAAQLKHAEHRAEHSAEGMGAGIRHVHLKCIRTAHNA